MKSLIRESMHISGDYKEVDWFPVRKLNSKRKAKAKPSTEAQKALNARNAKRRLTWLIQENFGTNDYWLHLTYPIGLDNDYLLKARMIEKFIRRVREKFKKENCEFKYVYNYELGKRDHRVHHHVFISGNLGIKVLRNEWLKQFGEGHRGCFQSRKLKFTRTGLARAAFYEAKDPMLSYRAYSCSKNLKKPKESKRDGRISRRKLKDFRDGNYTIKEIKQLYPGYEVVDVNNHLEIYNINEYGEVNELEFPYLTIRLFRSDSKYIIRDEE